MTTNGSVFKSKGGHHSEEVPMPNRMVKRLLERRQRKENSKAKKAQLPEGGRSEST
jgi:hypothetical protein